MIVEVLAMPMTTNLKGLALIVVILSVAKDPCILTGGRCPEIDEIALRLHPFQRVQGLYIGVTSNLETRVWEHKNPSDCTSFTAKYGINQLVYFEQYATMATAIAREKELKGWLRVKKIALIVANNPTWRDLSSDWGKPVVLFREPGN